jgi:hypothetical protein
MGEEPLISIAAAAREVGLNKSTLSRQVASGAIRSHGGKVKLSEVYEDRVKNIDATIWSNRPKKTATAANPAHAPLHATPDGEPGGDQPKTVEIDGKVLDINSAKALKETYLGRLAKLKFKTESAALVDADAVHRAVFELSRQDRDAWSNWPARTSPLMASELGVDQVKLAVILERYVREHLAEQSRSAPLRIAS